MSLIPLIFSALALADGAGTYKTYCAPCHGASGRGDGPAAADLAVKPTDFTDRALWVGADTNRLTRVVKTGGEGTGLSPLMPPWGATLSEAEINQVVAYLKTFEPK